MTWSERGGDKVRSIPMRRVAHIDRLPANIGEFIEEVASGLTALYGEKAGFQYRRTARSILQTTISHAAVDVVAVWEEDAAAGLLLGVTRGRMAQVSFIHVLRRCSNQGVEDALVTEAVRTFRANGIGAILSECVPFCPLRLDAVFEALGFERIERTLMSAPLDSPALTCCPAISTPYAAREWDAVAGTIVEAYQDHPGRKLHTEVRDEVQALTFLDSVASGGYGSVKPAYGRAVWRDGECAGVVVGCEIAPEMGFVLQLAVRPAYQRCGLGTGLLRDLAEAFRGEGLVRMILGVTRSNPAKRLYDRLGFEPIRPVNAYVWWDAGMGCC